MDSYGSSDFPLGRSDDSEFQSPTFAGDFYREVDNVCRGLTIPTEDVPGQALPFKDFGGLDSDFYREPQHDVCSGLGIAGGFSLDAPAFSNKFPLDYTGTTVDYSGSTACSNEVQERFQEGDVPPPVPNDVFFNLEVTTLNVATRFPFEIGNHLLDFFDKQVVSSVSKVRRAKFWIKTDTFVDSMMCTLKARVYAKGSDQYAIELQRRSGDAVCFSNVFHKASTYLQSQPDLGVSPSEAPPPPPLLGFQAPSLGAEFIDPVLDEGDIGPLLDMASLPGSPWLQAEAASSLGRMAEEGKPIVRTPGVFQILGGLMQTSSMDVAYPTASLVSHLARQSEAATLFASYNILPMLVAKVCAAESSNHVRRLYAQAICNACTWQSPTTLSSAQISELHFQLSDACSRMCVAKDEEVASHLEMARNMLSRQAQAPWP